MTDKKWHCIWNCILHAHDLCKMCSSWEERGLQEHWETWRNSGTWWCHSQAPAAACGMRSVWTCEFCLIINFSQKEWDIFGLVTLLKEVVHTDFKDCPKIAICLFIFTLGQARQKLKPFIIKRIKLTHKKKDSSYFRPTSTTHKRISLHYTAKN